MESLQETAQGIRVVKSFTLESYMRERQLAAIVEFRDAANKLTREQSRSSPTTEIAAGLAISAVVVYGGYRVIIRTAAREFLRLPHRAPLAYEPAKRVARLHVDLDLAAGRGPAL